MQFNTMEWQRGEEHETMCCFEDRRGDFIFRVSDICMPNEKPFEHKERDKALDLIAAAPEMFDALAAIMFQAGASSRFADMKIFDIARAALRKAKGE